MSHRVGPTHRIPGLVLTDHRFSVPLDHDDPGGETLTIFAREIVSPDAVTRNLPWLVYLQGGPGFESPRPMGAGGWIKRALRNFRVLLLDQRGTGLSTPITTDRVLARGQATDQARYLSHFRADAIVKDAEIVRAALAGDRTPWSLLGQSFGGFCALRYLSHAPEHLSAVFITGGIPPLDRNAEEVYRATYERVRYQNDLFFARYPEAQGLSNAIATRLAEHDVRAPNGDRITPRRFQQLGLSFGASDGFESIYYLLERALDGEGAFGLSFLRAMENCGGFETNPIYAILHEAIYCQGDASRWAAHRVRESYPEFQFEPGKDLRFTGEMVYPWMFEEYGQLAPLREAAELLAAKDDWPRLYDLDKLSRNSVPTAAIVYYDDMYVERPFSEESARRIPGARLWITNQYEHNGLRADGERILDQLIAMARGHA